MSITGTGGATSGNDNDGMLLAGAGTVVSAGSGGVTLTGTGGGSGSHEEGVDIQAATVKATVSGAVTINGSGSSTGAGSDYGVSVSSKGTLSTVNGNLTVNGAGAGAGNGLQGVHLNDATVSTVDGALAITGSGGAGTGYAFGIDISNQATVKSAGAGSVTITCAGGNGSGNINEGVEIYGSGTQVSAGSGGVTITGSGGGSGNSEEGVRIAFGATLSATSSGNVTITGTGSATGTNTNIGVYLLGNPHVSNAKVSTVDGAITLTGTGGSGSGSDGIAVQSGALIQSSGAGNVSLTGQAAGGNAAIFFDTGHASGIQVATGNVALTGDTIDLGDSHSIASTGPSGASHLLILQSCSRALPIWSLSKVSRKSRAFCRLTTRSRMSCSAPRSAARSVGKGRFSPTQVAAGPVRGFAVPCLAAVTAAWTTSRRSARLTASPRAARHSRSTARRGRPGPSGLPTANCPCRAPCPLHTVSDSSGVFSPIQRSPGISPPPAASFKISKGEHP